METQDLLAVLSLGVAALAVFVSPLVSWAIARRQIASEARSASRQVLVPMRHAWIGALRDALADLTSAALHYHVSGFDERTDGDYRHLAFLEQKIALMLNPTEPKHIQLEGAIRDMVSSLERGKEEQAFVDAHRKTTAVSRSILKTEWDRVKSEAGEAR